MQKFSHIKEGRAHIIDISNKDIDIRSASASGIIKLHAKTIEKIRRGTVEKGNVFATARTAAILAVKKTPDIIPMCHQIAITAIDVTFDIEENHVTAKVDVRSVGKTGVEMDALTGVSVALLTVWDMVKSSEKDKTGNYPTTCIENIHVVKKIKEQFKPMNINTSV